VDKYKVIIIIIICVLLFILLARYFSRRKKRIQSYVKTPEVQHTTSEGHHGDNELEEIEKLNRKAEDDLIKKLEENC
jgi:hypothetical protein